MLSAAALGLILTASQLNALNYALQAGESSGTGYTLAAIEWAESSFCVRKGTSWSRGCLGLKRKTARIFDPTVTRLQLTEDNERNVHDGLLFLLYCKDHTKDWRHMVAAYHYGVPAESKMSPAQIDADKYVLSVASKVAQLREVREDRG